jgi:hypothetical protein
VVLWFTLPMNNYSASKATEGKDRDETSASSVERFAGEVKHRRMVMNMKGFYPLIAFGAISFYIAVGLVIFTYAITIRLLPTKVKIPVVSRSLERIRAWLR